MAAARPVPIRVSAHDPEIAEIIGNAALQPMYRAGELQHARAAGDATADQHDRDQMAANRHSGVVGRLRVGADDPNFVAPAREVEQPTDTRGQEDRGRQAPMHAAPELRNLRPDARGGPDRTAAGIEPGTRRDPVHQQRGNEIEQQRADEFADTGIGTRQRRTQDPKGSAADSRHHHQRQHDPGGSGNEQAHPRRGHGAGVELPFRSDIPCTDAQADGDRQAGQDQRRHQETQILEPKRGAEGVGDHLPRQGER
jgi:hypothetical protein